MMSKETRSFGDGKVIGEIGRILDPRIPWSKKVYWQAKSNGCYRPNAFLGEIAEKRGISDPEEVARIAAIEYSRQNLIYGMMVSWAKGKEDKSLYQDITETQRQRPPRLKFEQEHVPGSFAAEGGVATGLAQDPAFFIVNKICHILGGRPSSLKRQAKFLRALNILEKQVEKADSLDDLHKNFFRAIKKKG